MALNNNGLAAKGNGLASAVKYASIHTIATPDAAGSGESTAPRKAVTLTVSGGTVTMPSTAFTGGAASGPALSVGFWSAATAGTFYGSQRIETGDTTFNAAGELTIDSVVWTETSTD